MMSTAEHSAALHNLCIAPQQYRKISSQAESQMRSRTTREQYASEMDALHQQRDDAIPAPEDDISLRNNVLR